MIGDQILNKSENDAPNQYLGLNPLMSSVNQKVKYAKWNMWNAVGLIKHVWPVSGQQVLKG